MKEAIKKLASEFGRIGGKIKSKKKTKAARLNGKKGGRPKKEKKNESTDT